MTSSLYYDIDQLKYSDLLTRLEQYSYNKQMQIFALSLPKSDLKSEDYAHSNCFLLMSVGYKVALINGGTSPQEYEFFCEDIDDVIKYLYSKYEYRSTLGRYKEWGEQFIVKDKTLDNLNDLDVFWSSLKVTLPKDVKTTELLVTLCTGSVNDIKRVKADVPTTTLDRVKQKIQAFDADQTRFIYQELDKKIVKIQGLSGTGKTELLLHKLKELYQKPEKYKIFVTCHNKILADSLHHRIPRFFNFMKVTQQIEWGKRLWCTNAWGGFADENSGLYRYICYFYQIPFYPYKDVASFDKACQMAISHLNEKYKGKPIDPALDYIIIDECQDFKNGFYELCQMVVSKQVYMAGDVFQSIFAEDLSRNYAADYFLTKCYRTDPKTLMFAHGLGLGLFEDKRLRWLSREDWEACGYNYEENDTNIILKRSPVRRFLDMDDQDHYESMRLVRYKENGFFEDLHNEIQHIINENPTFTIDDLCIILLDNNQTIYETANYLEAKIYEWFGWKVNKAYETKKSIPGTLLVSNRNNVKGLEYPFVICVTKKIVLNYTYRNAIYTMLTRSFLKTILFLPNEGSNISESIMYGYHEIMTKRQMTIRVPNDTEKREIETRFQAAKRRMPFDDLLKKLISEMQVPDETEKHALYQSANYMGWEDLSEEEIKEKLFELFRLRTKGG